MPKPFQPESRPIGTTTIHVHDDEFFNGFQAGKLLYHLQDTSSGFTDTEIYTFICKHSQSVQTTDRYRAGCISGWFAALYDYQQPALSPLVPHVPKHTIPAPSANHRAQERREQA